MNPQSFSDYNPEASRSQNLSQTVEELEVKLERLQALAQTLIGGLMVAILITIGVSGWFAYRLILQEQEARRKAEDFQQTESQLQDQINTLEQRINTQQQQMERLREQIPQDLATLESAVNNNQEKVELLQEELSQLETIQEEETSTPDASDTKTQTPQE